MTKRTVLTAVWALCVWGMAPAAVAGITLTHGGSGTDGAFTPALDSEGVVEGVLTIDLRNALTAVWDHPITAPELAAGNTVYGRGVYDAAKWAVVFKYTSINIPVGLTVKFTNHPSRAPVVWLVTGDVTISGTVDLSGSDHVTPPALAEPGPGGFRGGMGYYGAGSVGSAGLGPGGGARTDNRGYGAGHATSLESAPTYGNPSLLPLLGGSGGGGDADGTYGNGGGGGGGALLIATPGTVAVSGLIQANGGLGYDYWDDRSTGSGSGGGIRIVSSTITGDGDLEAKGGTSVHSGGLGRIRIERVSVDEAAGSLTITPTPSVVALADAATPLLWPPTDGPTVKILTIGDVVPPADPRASFGAGGPDVAIPQDTTTTVVVETTNVEEASSVFVRVAPRSNANYTRTQATKMDVEGLDPGVIHWTATVPVQAGHSAVQVQVIRP